MVGLLNNPISQGLHALTLVLNLIYTSLSLFTASLPFFSHN